MYKNTLLKVGEPNDGIMLDVIPKTDFLLNEVVEDPLGFLEEQGALGFTGKWALKSMSIIGGDGEGISNVIRIVIFSQKTRSLHQEWYLIKSDKELTHFERLGQSYAVVKKYNAES